MFGYSKCALVKVAVSGLLVLAAGTAMASDNAAAQVANPYSPAYGHAYRHGAVPTRETLNLMKTFRMAYPNAAATGPETLAYGGGIDSIGVTSGPQKVYLVIYGSQWGTAGKDSNGNVVLSNDTAGVAPRLQMMFKGLGTGSELWSGVLTQYCDGAVSAGATSCPSGASFVPYPKSTVLAGVWYDNSAKSPSRATAKQLAQEAIKAAAHFGNTTAASNRYTQYVVVSPTGTHPDGFNAGGGFCAWHDYNKDAGVSSPYGDIAFTNMPYVPDAGASCGANFVNAGAAGTLDGVTIVEGHEYAETSTDQNPAGGWTNQTGSSYNGEENGDECAWISSGQGASANVAMGNGSYAMQSTWSNDTNQCDIAHTALH